jgi:hypothetical protein
MCVGEAKPLDQVQYEYNQGKAIAAMMDNNEMLSWAINSGYQ